jgi:hypothetical protein
MLDVPTSLVPAWLRRGLEAAIVAAIVAILTLWGDRLGAVGPYPLPAGLAGALVLGPAVFVLSVLPTAYPIAMTATRGEAVMGAVGGFLVAVDLAIVFAGLDMSIRRLEITLPAGVLAGLLALAPAAVGVVASQFGASLGFGRRAGARAAVTSAIAALVVIVVVAMLG